MLEKPSAERCNYWKTSRTSPDVWVDMTLALIEQFEGEVLASGYGHERQTGRAAYMIRFRVADETFRMTWPVLPTETGDEVSARRQAATMLYHDVKAKCVSAQVLGARVAFFAWLELPNGQPACQLTDAQLLDEVPRMLLPAPEEL